MYTDTENKMLDLATEFLTMERLIENISCEMLQEMIDFYGLQFEQPLDLNNRNAKRVICYCSFLRLYTIRLDDCVLLDNNMFEFLDSSLDYLLTA